MALGTPVNEGSNTGTTAAIAVGPVTIASGSKVYVSFVQRRTGSTNPNNGTISDTQTLTWDPVWNVLNTTGSIRVRHQLWRATANGSATTITCTPDSSAQICAMQVTSISGASSDITNFGTDVTSAAGDASPSMGSAPTASSTVLGFFFVGTFTGVTAPTNHTELVEVTIASAHTLETTYDAGSAAQSSTWTTTGLASIGGLVEVKLGAQDLTPSLFTNSQTFFAPTVTSTYALTPALFTNSQAFFAPTVTRGTITLTPSLFTNSQTFYSPTVTGGTTVLTPSLLTNSQTFYSPTVTAGSVGLTPSLVTNSQTFFAPAVASSYPLTPDLFTNTQTFYAATVTTGAVALTPNLFTNSQTFYAPAVTVGAVTLTPALFTNAQVFYSPIVAVAQAVTPDLFTNDQTFYEPEVTWAYATNAPEKRTLILPHMGSRVLNVPRPWQGQRSL